MDMASALQVGEVDALSFYVPSIFKFDDNFKIIYWYSDDFPLHPCCDIAATEIALQIKLPLIKKFLAGLQKSISEMEKISGNGYRNSLYFIFYFQREFN